MSTGEIHIPIPRAVIEQIARDVFAELQPAPRADAEAEDTRVKIERLMVKPFWSIAELAFVWGCSDTHVRNLLQRAEDESTEHPIPFCNLDGLIVFDRAVIQEWMRAPKKMKSGQRKSGGKRSRSHLREVPRSKAS